MEIAIILLVIAGVILSLGDIIMKKWISDGSTHLYIYIIALGIYLVGLALMVQSFRYKNMAIAVAILVIVNVVIVSLASWFYFKEPLSPIQLFGLVLGVIAVVIMELG